ncbi:MAG: YbbR-like domain-containing protein [Lachnospiraceae bacterium]
MLSKIYKVLTHNLGLKILAVLFSVIMWLVVVNISDPTIAKTFTTKVTLENEQYLTDEGLTYEVLDNSDTVSFRVEGPRSYIERMIGSDFKAVADLEATEDGNRVPITITPQRYAGFVNVATANYYVYLQLENLVSQRINISVVTTGEPADGRAVGESSASLTFVNVSGPESIMTTIDKAVATVDVSGLSSDARDYAYIILLDEDGNQIDTTDLNMNATGVTVSVDIQDTKSVGFTFSTSGTPADGYEYVSTTVSPESVTIKGDASILNTINTISIPSEVIDLTGASADIEKSVDISSYLPANVTLVDSSQSKIDIVANVEKRETRNFEVPVENITVKNLSSKYTDQFVDNTVTLSLSGLTSDLDALDVNTITGTIDAAGLSLGENTVTVEFELDEKYTQTKSSEIVIEIFDAAQSTTQSTVQNITP